MEMWVNKNDRFVLAFFNSLLSAENAVKNIEEWDDEDHEIQLGPIGILHQTRNGIMKNNLYGPGNTRRGAQVVMLMGIFAALLPAIPITGGVVRQTYLWGVADRLYQYELGLTDDDLAIYEAKLRRGWALLIIACRGFDVAITSDKVTSLGGKVAVHAFSS